MQDGQQHHPNGTRPPLAGSPVTVLGIPSVSIQDNRLVVGTSQTSSTRSYTPLKVMGDGSFGTVWLCDWHGPPNTPLSPMQCGAGARPQWAGKRLVAVKLMKEKWDERQKNRELESLRAIPFHPNVIPLYDFFLIPDTKEFYFVFESMEGNLYHLIKARKGRPFAGGLVSSIFLQIVQGLDHIHTNGYFHRDIKPENVLVTTTGLFDYTSVSPIAPPNAHKEKDVVVIVKLADFGLARQTNSQPPYTEYVSTRWYRAPEVLLLTRDYSNPVDMWAFGTIMAELVNLRPLFPGSNQVDQVARICDILGDPSDEYGVDMFGNQIGGGPWPRGIKLARTIGYQFSKVEPKDFYSLFDKTVPTSLINCIRDLLRYDPDKRLTSRQCLEHVYLQETIPRNDIPIPSGFKHATPIPIPHYVNGTHSHPSLPTPAQVISPQYSHSAQNLHQPEQFPDAPATHRTPYPIPPLQPHHPLPLIVTHNDQNLPVWSDPQADYPMDDSSQVRPHVNGVSAKVNHSPMVEDPLRHAQNNIDSPTNFPNKLGKSGVLNFKKKPSKWTLGIFGGDKSHHHSALPPVDETSPAVVFPSRKRTQSLNSDSRSLSEHSPVREQPVDVRDAKKNRKEAERLRREAEMAKRELRAINGREQARAVMSKRHQMLRNNVGDEFEWAGSAERRIEMSKMKGKQPASGPVRHEHHSTANNVTAAPTVNAAAGKFVMQADPLLVPPDRDPYRSPSERFPKARRREFDDDHSMSSSDVHSISRMSSISFATVDSDPGPSRLRNRPSLYGISRMTSRSSLRTSFDDFPPSARSSNSFSREGQLAHDFRTQASVTSHISGSVSPPPLQLLSLSPTISPSLSPAQPWLQTQQHHKEELLRSHSPPYIPISPRFLPVHNGQSDGHNYLLPLPPSPYGHPPSPYGYPPRSGHTPKSAKSVINPIFKVVSYKWDSTDGLVPDDSPQPPLPPPPLPLHPNDRLASPNTLPSFSELDAFARGGEHPPLSPLFTTPEV